MKRILGAMVLSALVAATAPATASIRYLGTRAIGTGSVDLSIETDGRTGVLAASDIVAWRVTMNDATSPFPIRTLTEDGSAGSLRSLVVIDGPAVTATATALSFSYGLGTLQFDAVGTIRPFYQIVSSLCSTGRFGNDGGCEQFDNGADYSSAHVLYSLHPATDTVIVATAASVPEPAAWLLLVSGFAIVGLACRRRSLGRA